VVIREMPEASQKTDPDWGF